MSRNRDAEMDARMDAREEHAPTHPDDLREEHERKMALIRAQVRRYTLTTEQP